MSEEESIIGPVDYVLLEYPRDRVNGDASRAVLDLVRAGTIRLWDVVLVEKSEDGTVRHLDVSDLPIEHTPEIAEIGEARSGLVDEEDVYAAAEVLEPGTMAALLVYENTWALPFLQATLRNGGTLAATGRIPYEVVAEAVEALEDDD